MKSILNMRIEFLRNPWISSVEVGWFRNDDPALLTLQLFAKDGDNYLILVRIQIVRFVFEFALTRGSK